MGKSHMAQGVPVTDSTSGGKHSSPTHFSALAAELTADDLEAIAVPSVVEEVEPVRKRSKLWIIPVVLLGIVGGTYFGGAAYFMQNTLPNTTVNGHELSLKPATDIKNALDQDLTGWSATVDGNGVTFVIDAAQAGLTTDSAAYANYVLSQTDPWTWPKEITEAHDYTIELKGEADHASVLEEITPALAASNEQLDEYENGGIFYNADTKRYEVPEAVLAGRIDPEAVADKIVAAAVDLGDTVEIGEDCLIKDDALITALDAANVYTAATPVTLTINGEEVFQVDTDTAVQWVRFGEQLESWLDEEQMTEWGRGPLSEQFDTVKQDRTYTRADGKEITVRGAKNTYGWMIDGAATATAVAEALRSGEPQTIEIPMLSTADYVNTGGREWKSYVDVDLSEQHARYYDDDDNLVWETDIVSGNPYGRDRNGNPADLSSPTGCFMVETKEEKRYLYGPIVPETGEYEWQSWVEYWMEVVSAEGVGLHDANWRYSFGGSIYTWNGSHGCINMPYSAIDVLFNMIEIGEPVIIHY